MTTQLTQAHTAALTHVLDTLDAGDAVDPDKHQEFLAHNANQTGLTAGRYPALHAAINTNLAAQPAQPPAVQPTHFKSVENVVFVATSRATGKLSARVLLTRTKPVAMMKVTVFVAMKQNGSTVVLAHGQVVQFVGQTVQVDTDPATAMTIKAGTSVTVLTSWVVNYQDGTVESKSHSIVRKVKMSTDPVITAPVQRPDRTTGDLADVVIGLGRGSGSGQDVDYWFGRGQTTYNLLVPLAGSVRLPYKLADIGNNNPTLEVSIALAEGGAATLSKADASAYIKYFSRDLTDKQGRTLLFDLTTPDNTSGHAIDFGPPPWAADTRCFFTAKITCAFDDLTIDPQEIVITSSAKPDDNPLDGVATIKPLVFVWHCFPAGTQILLANGTTKAIEHITHHDVVVSDRGDRPVLATLAQPHHGPITVLDFANGSELRASATHPIMTPTGLVQAASLRVGDTVLVHGGGHTTVQKTHEAHLAGHVLYNLWLDPQRPGDTRMIANGIVVGDHLMQGHELRAHATDPAKVRARLPKHMHVDYASWLEDHPHHR